MAIAEDMPDLCRVNRRLEAALTRLTATENPPDAAAEELAELLAEMSRVGEWLRVAGQREDLHAGIAAYRENLRPLQSLLPSLQARLLTERARLEAQRSHLCAASAWSKASKDSL